jgi:hypothetical protein
MVRLNLGREQVYRIIFHPNPSALRALDNVSLVQEIQRHGDGAHYRRQYADLSAFNLPVGDHESEGETEGESEFEGDVAQSRHGAPGGDFMIQSMRLWTPPHILSSPPRAEEEKKSPSRVEEEEKKSPVAALSARMGNLRAVGRPDVFPSASPVPGSSLVAGPLVASRTVTEIWSQEEEEKKSPARPSVARNLFAAFQAQQARALLVSPPRHQLRETRALSPLPSPIEREIEAMLAFEGNGAETPSAEGEWVIPQDTPYKSESPDSDEAE